MINDQKFGDEKMSVYGYIYRIYHPNLLVKNESGEVITPCYIGRTEKSVASRFQGHLRDAKKVKGKNEGGDGKLHAVMWGHGINEFVVEELDYAYSADELSRMEKFYQEKFQSIKFGWNKIIASTITKENVENLVVVIDGMESKFESVAHMCRMLNISNSTYTYWLAKKGCSIQDAISNALNAQKISKEKSNQSIVIFRPPYSTLNDAVRDLELNKHKLNEKTIRGRIKKGMSAEDAFTTPPQRIKLKNFHITTPDGVTHQFQSLADAHRQLSKSYTVPPYSTVNSFFNQKQQTAEQAFGFVARPWEGARYAEADKLIAESGYNLVGKRDGQSNPVILHATKEIFGSVKSFANTFGIDYTTAAEEIKRGLTPEEILIKRKHPAIKIP